MRTDDKHAILNKVIEATRPDEQLDAIKLYVMAMRDDTTHLHASSTFTIAPGTYVEKPAIRTDTVHLHAGTYVEKPNDEDGVILDKANTPRENAQMVIQYLGNDVAEEVAMEIKAILYPYGQ